MKKFEHVLIVSDMDGTFLGKDGCLVERNLKALEYFRSEGGLFTFSSGRSHDYIKLSVPHPEQIVNLPAVTVNGVCLYDFEKECYVEAQRIEPSVIQSLVRRVLKEFPTVGIRAVTGDEVLMGGCRNSYMEWEWKRVETLRRRRLSEDGEWGEIAPFKLVLRDKSECLNEVWKTLEGEFSDRLVFTKSELTLLELMPIGTNKGVMVEHLHKLYAPQTTLLCVVGDYLNDLEMLAVADLPVCPANACDEAKALCKLCLCDHKEGVIADLVEYLDQRF